MARNLTVFALLFIILLVPFVLRPDKEQSGPADRRLVIVTPHNEAIRYEFARAFAAHWMQQTGEHIAIDWRNPGGTSEIARYLASEFLAAFRYHWTHTLDRPWTATVEAAFDNRKLSIDNTPDDDTEAETARRAFLDSTVGCGIDLFFGGGSYDFSVQAAAGRLVDCGLLTRHPELFSKNAIPQTLGGEEYHDKNGRWFGSCLSSFGICYNQDSLARLGIDTPPSQWQALADPRYSHEIALADPTKSGSVAKAFEMLIQQQMQIAVSTRGDTPEVVAVAQGWTDAMRLIRRISSNARYFTDSASKIPLDVSLGDAAAGMCIDFYGRFQSEAVRADDGSSRMIYLTPKGGSSVGVDPIGMLRGAPDRDLAEGFIDFVLSLEGQKLWNFEVGTPDGPERFALRRLPIRRELYTAEYIPHRSDPDVDAYQKATEFEYHGEWSGKLFNASRFIIRIACLDTHDELRAAWHALQAADFPPQATARFDDVSAIDYHQAQGIILDTLRSSDKISEVRLARELGAKLRAQYHEVEELANAGK